MCIFIGYPKGTKEGLFYCPKEQKIIVSTNVKFLEQDYLTNHVSRSKHVLHELSKGIIMNETSTQKPKTIVDIPLHPCSGRNVNRKEVAQEDALEVSQKQIQNISLPQSSQNNVVQPEIEKEVVLNVHNLVQDVANRLVASLRSGRVIRKL